MSLWFLDILQQPFRSETKYYKKPTSWQRFTRSILLKRPANPAMPRVSETGSIMRGVLFRDRVWASKSGRDAFSGDYELRLFMWLSFSLRLTYGGCVQRFHRRLCQKSLSHSLCGLHKLVTGQQHGYRVA